MEGYLNTTHELLSALGINHSSFCRFVSWALCEHLATSLVHDPQLPNSWLSDPEGLKNFRDYLRHTTQRHWSVHDLNALFDRVRSGRATHFREPVPYAEYLKLLWQVPFECAKCKRKPPEVQLHVDHIVPASKGGKSTRANLRFLCAKHNLRKSNKREEGEPWLDLQ